MPRPASAQEAVLEEQVPLDEAGAVLRLDAELARALGLFSEFRDLREVLLFRSGDAYILEITRRREGRLFREPRRLTEAEVAALRSDISSRLAARGPERLLDQEGRYPLLATSTAAGLAFYGWGVPAMFDVDDTRGQVALYVLVSSASFFGPWLWSEGRPVTPGMASAAAWGGTRGIVHGDPGAGLLDRLRLEVAPAPDARTGGSRGAPPVRFGFGYRFGVPR